MMMMTMMMMMTTIATTDAPPPRTPPTPAFATCDRRTGEVWREVGEHAVSFQLDVVDLLCEQSHLATLLVEGCFVRRRRRCSARTTANRLGRSQIVHRRNSDSCLYVITKYTVPVIYKQNDLVVLATINII